LKRIASEIEAEPSPAALARIHTKGVIAILGVLDSTDLETNLRAMNTALTAEQGKYWDDASRIALGDPRALQEEIKD
jgi:diketogulonate reductase-like aldo/keto reductase